MFMENRPKRLKRSVSILGIHFKLKTIPFKEATHEVNVTVWNEFRHEKTDEAVKKVYPDGIHNAIAREEGIEARTAALDEPEHGLTDDVLNATGVLIWWGHMAHEEVSDAVMNKVWRRITEEGMGLIALHSAHAWATPAEGRHI